jgi:hypothetical protein
VARPDSKGSPQGRRGVGKKNYYNLKNLIKNLRDNEKKVKAKVASGSKAKKLRKAG